MAGFGFLGFIGLGKESTWGTAVSATDYLEAMSESLNAERDRFEIVNIRNQFGRPADQAGMVRINGDIEAHAHPTTGARLLKGALQNSSKTTVSSGVLYTHTFKTLTTGSEFSSSVPVQPYTIEVFRDVTSSVQYAGCAIDTLAINFQPNQDVRFTASFIGKSESQLSSTTPTFPTTPGAPFNFDTASLELGGSATSRIEALTVEIANNLEGVPKLNASNEVGKIQMTDFQSVSISGTIAFEDLTEYQDFIDQNEKTLKATVTKPDSFSMTVDVPRMVYTAFPTEIGGRERLTVDFEAQGFYHTGSGTNIQVDLTTTVNTL